MRNILLMDKIFINIAMGVIISQRMVIWFFYATLFIITPITAINAQQNSGNYNSALDAITEQVMNDAFIALRFAALSLEDDDEAGQALEGLVRAMLSRGEFTDALKEATRIDDNIWFARAMISISQNFMDNGDNGNAVEYLNRGLKRIDINNISKQADQTRRAISIQHAIIGNLDGAKTAAKQINIALYRIDTIKLAAGAHQKVENYSQSSKIAAIKLLKYAYNEAKILNIKSQSIVNIFLDIGEAQASSGDINGAMKTYYFAYDLALSGERKGRFASYAKLASALTHINDTSMAMTILRKIDEGGDRSIALSSIAKSMSGSNKVDSSLPLFLLAIEQARDEKNLQRRYAIYAQIVNDQTTIGRLADAFTTAGLIKNDYIQSLALLRMGENLIAQNRLDDAYVLVDYIPFIGMRAKIFAATAVSKSLYFDEDENEEKVNPVIVSDYLMKGLKDTGYKDPSLFHLPQSLHNILTTQILHGNKEIDLTLFERVEELAFTLNEPNKQVEALSYLAMAQAQRQMFELANKSISSAWRIAWQNKHEKIYADTLSKISQSQIKVGDILSAFDTAARISKPTDDKILERAADGSFIAPRFDALTSVAAAAAQSGDNELAIRIAKQIRFPQAQAAALAAVAVAIASPDKPLRDIVGIGPTKRNLYDMLIVRFSNDVDNKKLTEEAININKF